MHIFDGIVDTPIVLLQVLMNFIEGKGGAASGEEDVPGAVTDAGVVTDAGAVAAAGAIASLFLFLSILCTFCTCNLFFWQTLTADKVWCPQ